MADNADEFAFFNFQINIAQGLLFIRSAGAVGIIHRFDLY